MYYTSIGTLSHKYNRPVGARLVGWSTFYSRTLIFIGVLSLCTATRTHFQAFVHTHIDLNLKIIWLWKIAYNFDLDQIALVVQWLATIAAHHFAFMAMVSVYARALFHVLFLKCFVFSAVEN